MTGLRDYQITAIERARRAVAAGQRRVCLVAPTGAGKTAIGAEIVRSAVALRKCCVWAAHRTELVDQAADRLTGVGLTVGVVAAASMRRPQPYAPVQVCSFATLMARESRPKADVIVLDECHHAVCRSHSEFVASYPNAVIIGLTATPERGDGRGLGDVFQRLVTVATIRDLIAAGHLVDCDVIAPRETLRPGQVAQRPVDAYRTHTPGESAIVFAQSVQHAEAIRAEFLAAGIEAQVIEADTTPIERAAALRRFRAGDLRVLINCMVLTEGFDAPRASVCILARGCGTPGLYLQMVGRVLRPADGKERAALIDLRGVSHTHGHPCEDREYSLEGRGIRAAGAPVAGDVYCRVCGAPTTPGEPCPECGIGARLPKPLVVTGDALVKYAAARRQAPERRAQNLAKWALECRARGWKPSRALMKYRAVYGQWPDERLREAAQRLLTAGAA